jgi:hypothetical protein
MSKFWPELASISHVYMTKPQTDFYHQLPPYFDCGCATEELLCNFHR